MNTTVDMYVIKRNGDKEMVQFDKVLERMRKAATGLSVNYTRLAQLTLSEIHDGVQTSELDELAARMAISYITVHPDWGHMASQIIISNCQRNAPARFSEATAILASLKDSHGNPTPALAADVIAFIRENADALDAIVQPANDFLLDYFGFKTLERAYLMRDRSRRIVETPQYMWLRVAVGIWGSSSGSSQGDIPLETRMDRIKETYELMSSKAFTHATPTLFNSGTPRPQLSSCFLVAMKNDSIEGIFDTLKQCAQISKYAGGIGLHVHNIRAQGTIISGTQGTSNGLVPMLRVFNNTARYVDQCFLPGALIYTEAGPCAIENIGVGDKVLTSTGAYEVVNRPLRHEYSGPVMKLSIKHSIDPVFVTPEHNVMALTGQNKTINHAVIHNRLDKNLKTVEWVDVKDLQEGDFLAFQIPTYEKDIPSLSEDDCRLMGIMLGDGYISSDVSGVSMNTVTKAAAIAFVKEYFGMRGVKLYIDEQPNITRISWSSANTDFKYTRAQLYDAAGSKCMPAYMLHLPRAKILQILRGVIETDGCVGTKEITLELTSRILIEQVRYIVLRLGGLTSGYARDRVGNVSSYKNITTRLPSWSIRIPRLPDIMNLFPHAAPSEYFTFFRHDDMLFSRIENIEEDTYTGVVHDFEVDTTHDYTVAHMGVAHNGGGKRNGSFAIYLEPWHADIQAFLKMKSNTGSEEERARDLFYALWIPDLFMKRVEAGGDWSLFCPHEAPGLADVYGDAFEALYERYEQEGRAKRTVSAQKLWSDILVSQIETGTPYLLYKDAANMKSNQKNLGTIKSSNLCVAPETELEVYEDEGEWHGLNVYETPKKKFVRICDLVNQKVTIWNGNHLSDVVVKKTGEDQQLLTVTVMQRCRGRGEFMYMDCTPYHKFIMESDRSIAKAPRVDAHHLQPGDRLYSFTDDQGDVVEQTVVSVMDHGRRDDTYCFNEPENHAGVFNGILAGNCTEIMEYSDEHETAVCNLASIALPHFLERVTTDGRPGFNFDRLRAVTEVIVRNLNRVIDINYYPTPEAERSNMRHRPIGLGVQGLADVFAELGMAWETPEAAALNQEIFENIYYAALSMSATLSARDGPYETFIGSPASKGLLQPDLWVGQTAPKSAAYLDWAGIRETVKAHGLRNSLLVAPMPTASTSQILGYNECIEPFTTNIYARRTLAGEFTVVNKYLVADLLKLGLWSSDMKDRIIAANGSIQGIADIPADIKSRYKTVWEIKQKTLIDMAADRGAYICQSQSLNLFVQDPTIAKLSSMHFYAWRKGLKTGLYYLRTKSAVQAIKFTVDPSMIAAQKKQEEPTECLLCSS
jgi:ribonucleotide reductase alpha subunit